MVFIRNSLIASVLALALSSSADAHITFVQKFVEPNQNLTTALHVPHGCNGSSTVGISVTIPKNITVIAPQQVSNWTLTTAYTDDTNTTVSSFSWTGGYLKATDALDFPVNLTAPNVDLSSASNATFAFPVVQTCEVGVNNWNVTDGSAVGEPAPVIVVVKNATQAAADALRIKNANNATASASGASSAPTAGSTSAANGLIAGLVPVAVAAIAAAVLGF